jgi:hypothetical protein
MYAWAENAGLKAEDLIIDVSWKFDEEPQHRVGSYEIRFAWPSLPAKRLPAAKRVAEMCTIHATFMHPPTVSIDGTASPSTTESVPPTPSAKDGARRIA